MIWESFLFKTVDSDILKKNLNTPQVATHERRAENRSEEARVETEKQKKLQKFILKNIQAEKAPKCWKHKTRILSKWLFFV